MTEAKEKLSHEQAVNILDECSCSPAMDEKVIIEIDAYDATLIVIKKEKSE